MWGCSAGVLRSPETMIRSRYILNALANLASASRGGSNAATMATCAAFNGLSHADVPGSRDHTARKPAHARMLSRNFGTVVPFPLAQTGEGISECELLQWYIKEGELIEQFGKVCEVQSDKATIEITSRHTGKVHKLHWAPGDTVKVGAALMDIELEAAVVSPEAAGPAMAESTHAGEPAPATPAATAAAGQPEADVGPSGNVVFASPAVRQLAREKLVDLRKVPGTGPEGRITREDVLSFVEIQELNQAPIHLPQSHQRAPATTPPTSEPVTPEPSEVQRPPVPLYTTPGATRTKITGYRRAMVRSMTEAASVPMFHYQDEVVMDALMALRQQLKTDPALQGAKLTYLPFIIKAASIALHRFPLVNSSLVQSATELLQHSHHNIGVAMNTSGGLVVPNIKNVEQKGLVDIALDLGRLQQLAAAGKLGTADVTGGTLTISNIGTVGGTYTNPLVNPPEVAIVALGKTRTLPRFDSTGAVVPRALMCVSWGADHRVVDGATMAEFSNLWKSFIEEPQRLLLHLR